MSFISELHDLEQAMKAEVHVEWPTSSSVKLRSVCAHELAGILRRSTDPKFYQCNRLVLHNVQLVGPLDLSGAGRMGSPVLPFELDRCCLQGGLDTSHAYLQGVVLRDCSLEKIEEAGLLESCKVRPATLVGKESEPFRLRFTGASIAEKVEIRDLTATPDTILDFSHTTIDHGCELVGIACAPEKAGTESQIRGAISCITFVGASITGGLTLEGVHVHATQPIDEANVAHADGIALNCTELRLQGSLNLRNSLQTSFHLKGEFRLAGASIRGEIRCRGTRMESLPWSENVLDPPLTIAAAGLEVGQNVYFWNDYPVEPKSGRGRQSTAQHPCRVIGQIDLSGARIGGDLQMAGMYEARDHTRILNAKSVHIGGDVRFGWLLGLTRTCCQVEGEVDFSNAQIGGKFVVSGASLLLKRNQSVLLPDGACSDASSEDKRPRRRWQKFAVKLVGATVHNNVVLQGSNKTACRVEGLALTGATIGGQLVIEGADVEHVANMPYGVPFREGKARKAISANGVTINGGIFISDEAEVPVSSDVDPLDQRLSGKLKPTRIDGDFRIRNARVHGPVIFRGVTLKSSDGRIALWAAGATFGSDFILMPSKHDRVSVDGEIRMGGATIQGHFRMEGVVLIARDTGSALDASLMTVVKAVYIGRSTEHSNKPGERSEITGLVNLNFLNSALLTLGSDPRSISARESTDTWLRVTGAILLREAKIRGPIVFSEVELIPSEELPYPKGNNRALNKLKELSIFRPNVVVYAIYAELGNRLFVRLKRTSYGLISLYGSRTGTIGALYAGDNSLGNRSSGVVDECWGEKPPPVKGYRAGKPPAHDPKRPWISLSLDEFRYNRFFDKEESRSKEDRECDSDREQISNTRAILRGFIGRPSEDDLLPRHGWLRHQISNPGMPNEIVTWPYRQVARVYRDMGDLKRAYTYETERRWLEICHGKRGPIQRFIDSCFGILFGFGYSSDRAALWLLGWFTVFTAFIRFAGPATDTCSVGNAEGVHNLYKAAAEAIRFMFPDILKFHTEGSCVFRSWDHDFLGGLFHFFFGFLRLMGGILIVGATLTFTGVLQEKAPVATSMKN